jgi:hypothetical protein
MRNDQITIWIAVRSVVSITSHPDRSGPFHGPDLSGWDVIETTERTAIQIVIWSLRIFPALDFIETFWEDERNEIKCWKYAQ